MDIGGTFTDLVAVDSETGHVTRAKADTTPARLETGVMMSLERSGVDAPTINVLVHGTTVVINTILERRGVLTALVTTRGFRDILHIGRANRPDLYNLSYRKPLPFVARRHCYEVSERLTHRGEVLVPLREDDVRQVADQLRAAGVGAVAVCFLHAWANPVHEARAATLLTSLLPGVAVMPSHAISNQWREYERASTAVLSAYTMPVVASYLDGLEQTLHAAAVDASMYVMRSSGGVCSFAQGTRTPISLLESGPVAGVTAAVELGRRLGARHVLALDIGGTTAKTAAIRDGQVRVSTLHHVEATPWSAGYPIQTPVVEIIEIGAGGGSIAWTDAAGGLHLGPQSAGAEPGPACYGRGGTQATLTDANLVSGRLDPDYFLGGAIRLNTEAALDALSRLGTGLGVGAHELARGILRYAVAQMTRALRLVTVRRGHDPRDFVFVAYGGAGPLHAALLARELGIRRTVIPAGPGHFSAFGMVVSDLRAEAVKTRLGPLDLAALSPAFSELEQGAKRELDRAGDRVHVDRFVELRYQGQEHTLEVPVEPDAVSPAAARRVRDAFDQRSWEAYALTLAVPVETVAVRVSVTAPIGKVTWPTETVPGVGSPPAPVRRVDFDQHGGVLEAPVIERWKLAAQGSMRGPCIVEEAASTTLVLPGQVVASDDLGNLVIEEAS